MYRTLHKLSRDFAMDMFLLIKKQVVNAGLDGESYIYVFPWGNFGEHTYILGHLPLVRKKNKICLILTESKKWLIELFPHSYDFVVLIPDNFKDKFDRLFDISYFKEGSPYIVWTDIIGNGRFNSELVFKNGRLTLSESYAFALELPLISRPLAFSSNFPAADNMPLVRNTLIIPGANTAINLDKEYWVNMYNKLKGSNCNPVIDSTYLDWDLDGIEHISLPEVKLIDYVTSKCKAVVGLRSGILDLLGGGADQYRYKIVAIYPVIENSESINSTGLSTKGVANSGVSISKCWSSANILDIEYIIQSDCNPFYNDIVNFIK